MPTARQVRGLGLCAAFLSLAAGSSHGRAQSAEPKPLNVTAYRTLSGHTECVNAVAFSPNGKALATAGSDCLLKLWDVATGKETFSVKHPLNATSVAFSPDGKLLAVGSGSYVQDKAHHGGHPVSEIVIHDSATGKTLHELRLPDDDDGLVSSVAFSPNGKLLAAGHSDSLATIWDTTTWKQKFAIDGPVGNVNTVAFSPDSRELAVVSSNQIVLIDPTTGEPTRSLKGCKGSVMCVAFSPDGRRVAAGCDDDTIVLWERKTGAVTATLTGHSSFVEGVAFSPDSKTLASASWDKTVRLWNPASGTCRQTLPMPGQEVIGVTSVAFSPDGRLLAAGSGNKTTQLWNVDTKG